MTAIVLTLGPISGAHFNPVITVSMGATGNLPWREVYAYLSAQLVGAFAGVVSAHWMFGQPWISMSHHSRNGGAQLWREAVATFGLLFVVWASSQFHPSATAYAVGAYITAAHWFTGSTSFANPAVTLARAASDTFAGIRPADVPALIAAQIAGGIAATVIFRGPVSRSLPVPQVSEAGD